MSTIVGIDIGGSTTKIAGFRGEGLLIPALIKADSPIASLFGAFGKFLYDNRLNISDIDKVNITGVGSSYVDQQIYGIPTFFVDEFIANGIGGRFFSKSNDIVVVSMGTGTSFVHVHGDRMEHLGGIGIGGGTLIGLANIMLNTSNIEEISKLAEHGEVGNIDLRIVDITRDNIPTLMPEVTASNFAKAVKTYSKEDVAAGIIHMVLENILQTAVLTSKQSGIKEFVLIGNMTNFSECNHICDLLRMMNPDIEFTIPPESEFATAIGAACTKKHLREIGV